MQPGEVLSDRTDGRPSASSPNDTGIGRFGELWRSYCLVHNGIRTNAAVLGLSRPDEKNVSMSHLSGHMDSGRTEPPPDVRL